MRLPKLIPTDRYKSNVTVYLVQLVIPAIFLFEFPWPKALIGGCLIVLFAVAYSLCAKPRWTNISIVVQALLLLIMVGYLYPAYAWVVFYPAAGIGLSSPTARALLGRLAAMVLPLIAECMILGNLHPDEWSMIVPMVLVAVFGSLSTAFGCLWQQRMRASQLELQRANAQIERLTVIAERERISQDLHDVMGHELSMITLKSQLVERLIDQDTTRAKQEVRDVQQAARRALGQVREYIAGIRQPQLDEEWAAAAVLLRAAGMECETSPGVIDMQASADGESGMTNAAQALAMCVRETCTNIVRHSGATRVAMQFRADGSSCAVVIGDNGKGLPWKTHNLEVERNAPAAGGGGVGIGMTNMKSRISAVSGTIEAWSHGEPVTDVIGWPPQMVSDMRGLVVRFTVPIGVRSSEKEALG